MSRPVLILKWLLVLVLLVHAILLVWIMAHRVGHPYPLEWLEGDEFHHALRILQGRSWYPAPGPEFLPSYYPPGYALVSAAWMQVFGTSLPVMRWVGVLATAACAVALFLLARRHTRNWFDGAVAAGFFLACYPLSGAWYDVARVDMLALACVLWGLVLTQRHASTLACVGGFALLLAAAWVKQNHMAFLLFVTALWFMRSWRRGVAALFGAALVCAILVVVLQRASDGWFLFYTWTFPGYIEHEWHTLPEFFRLVGFGLCGWTLPLLAVLGFRRSAARQHSRAIGFLIVALAVAVSGWSNPAGFVNNIIPVVAAWSLLVALLLGTLRDWRLPGWCSIALMLVILQLVMLLDDPRPWCPTAADRAAGDEVVRVLSDQPGPVLAPYHPYFLHLSGHPMHLHFHLVNEIIRARNFGFPVQDNDLLRQLMFRLQSREWRAYVSTAEVSMGELHNTWIDVRAQRRYRRVLEFLPEQDTTTLYMRSGNQVRPAALYVPITSGTAPTRDGS